MRFRCRIFLSSSIVISIFRSIFSSVLQYVVILETFLLYFAKLCRRFSKSFYVRLSITKRSFCRFYWKRVLAWSFWGKHINNLVLIAQRLLTALIEHVCLTFEFIRSNLFHLDRWNIHWHGQIVLIRRLFGHKWCFLFVYQWYGLDYGFRKTF